ncbi:hypothetical protein [Dehalobacter sp. 12DCB1]|uniref:DUF4376 domain-containing protein n=1 Tax=Dehalobacter sp. 12DCB1 TaxID=2070364 RepID=UPI001A9B5E08|nr:hypothetical protein [Dehalobacter sp. 12DCB1]
MILVENEVVLAVMDTYEQKENGKLINGCIFPMGSVINVITPADVVPQKYCYDSTNGFYLNPNYVEYISPEQELIKIKKKLGEIPPITSPSTLLDYQTNKIFELSKACEEEILTGFYSTARGTSEWYTNSRDDQSNIIAQATLATLNPAIIPQWKSANESICTDFTLAQMTQLATDGAIFKTERIKTFETLKVAVLACTTIEEVEAISWSKKVWS